MVEHEGTAAGKKSGGTPKTAKKETGKKRKARAAEIERYTKEIEEIQDRYIRLAADFDNYKKRTAREFGELVRSANEELLSQLIPVLDNFERALEASSSSADQDSFHTGIELIYQQLRDMLEKQGVKGIEAVGEPFDPHRHEAVMMVEKEDVPPEMVVEEMARGYMLHDRVLRASKVAVSK